MKRIILLAFALSLIPSLLASLPRPEYPRPQMEREEWINLNGEWTYRIDHSGSGAAMGREFFKSNGFEGKITVPFAPESKLSGVGYTEDYIQHLWYHRKVDIPAAWAGKKILLHFGAVFYKTEVYLDGQFLTRHFGGSSPFTIDLTSYAKPGSQHNLVVYAYSNTRGGRQTSGKQSFHYNSAGCHYTRNTGIWQTVWMEVLHPASLHSFQILPNIDQGTVTILPRFHSSEKATLKAILKDGDNVISSETVSATPYAAIVLKVPNAKLWSPESPFLYDLELQVMEKENKIVDQVKSYVGMRKIHTHGNKFYLNNKPYYQRLVLDQGFYPEGIWTAPSDEDLKKDIELSKAAGFNGARLHQKIFDPRFHYWADKLGYITWGESPSWGLTATDVEAGRNFIAEWTEIITRDRNHPSIVMWTPFNETYHTDPIQYPRLLEDLYKMTKDLDPTRPFHDASGGTHYITDIWSTHNYTQDPAKLKEELLKDGKLSDRKFTPQLPPLDRNPHFSGITASTRYSFPLYDGSIPYLLDEFGGIQWNPKRKEGEASWGYGNAPKTEEEFYSRLEGLVDAILSHGDHISGYCYTQLTDVEQEQNGIYYYDRSSKFDMERIRKIFNKVPDNYKTEEKK